MTLLTHLYINNYASIDAEHDLHQSKIPNSYYKNKKTIHKLYGK
jgi:hypothetical protein